MSIHNWDVCSDLNLWILVDKMHLVEGPDVVVSADLSTMINVSRCWFDYLINRISYLIFKEDVIDSINRVYNWWYQKRMSWVKDLLVFYYAHNLSELPRYEVTHSCSSSTWCWKCTSYTLCIIRDELCHSLMGEW